MLLSKAIEGFVVAKLASGYSSNTLGMYRVYLKLLSSFIHDADVDTITSADLERFMAWVSRVQTTSREWRYQPRQTCNDGKHMVCHPLILGMV